MYYTFLRYILLVLPAIMIFNHAEAQMIINTGATVKGKVYRSRNGGR